MKQDLLSQIKSSVQDQPGWLQQKRQLAGQLATSLSSNHFAKRIVDEWQTPDLSVVDDGQGDCSTADYVDLPLFDAAH